MRLSVTLSGCTVLWVTATAYALAASDLPVEYPLAMQREWQQEFREFTVENYVGMMQPELTSDEARRLGGVRFEFPVGADDPGIGFHSTSDGRVVLPVSTLLFYKDVTFSQAWLSTNGYSTMPALDFVTIAAHGGLARWPADLRLPKAALGIPAAGGNDSRVMARYEQYLLDLVLFVVGHELGHILHGFEGPNSADYGIRRQSERRADGFALELFRRMQRPPLGIALYFATTSRLQPVASRGEDTDDWTAWRQRSTHPLDGERIGAAAQAIERNRTDFVRGFASPATGPVRLTQVIGELNALASVVDDRSAALTQADCTATYLPADLLPRKADFPDIDAQPGEQFLAVAYSGIYDGKIVANKSGDSTALRLVLRRNGNQITGETQYLCFRGRLNGEAAPDGSAVLFWQVGAIRRSVSARSDASGGRIDATWRSENVAAGGDGSLMGIRNR